MQTEQKEGILVIEPKVESEAAESKAISIAELSELDLSPEEIEAAGRYGLTAKEGPNEKGEKKEPIEKKKVGDVGDEKNNERGKKEDSSEEKEKAKDAKLPIEVQDAFDDPEKESHLLSSYNKNEKGLYFKQKKERAKRQAAESERDHVLIKLTAAEERAKRLEAENIAFKSSQKSSEPKVDVYGNPVTDGSEGDAEDKPVTRKDLEEIAKKESERKEAEDQAIRDKTARAERLTAILNSQESEARSRYEDFVPAMEHAVKILGKVQDLGEILPDKRQAARAKKLCIDFFHATANADKFGEDDYNAADIAYELGKMHPDFKTGNGSKSVDKNVELNPESAKKAIENAGKRGSSAAVSGNGGKRFIPYDEMDAEQLANLSSEEFSRVPKSVRDAILSRT
jgi:hypothetical protein